MADAGRQIGSAARNGPGPRPWFSWTRWVPFRSLTRNRSPALGHGADLPARTPTDAGDPL